MPGCPGVHVSGFLNFQVYVVDLVSGVGTRSPGVGVASCCGCHVPMKLAHFTPSLNLHYPTVLPYLNCYLTMLHNTPLQNNSYFTIGPFVSISDITKTKIIFFCFFRAVPC